MAQGRFRHAFYIHLCAGLYLSIFCWSVYQAPPRALAQAPDTHIFFLHEWRLVQLCQSL